MRRLSERTISGTFLKHLTAAVVIGMGLSIVFGYIILTNQARQSAENRLQVTVEDIRKDILDESSDTLLDITEEIAQRLDFGLNLSPEDPITSDHLAPLLNPDRLSEIVVVDSRGIVTASTNADFIGYDMASSPQSAEFLVLLGGRQTEYVQSYQAIGYNVSVHRKYAARLLRRGGFVQVGYNSELYHTIIDTRIHAVAQNRHVGGNGFVIVADENGIIVSGSNGGYGLPLASSGIRPEEEQAADNTVFSAQVYGKKCFCRCLNVEGYRVFAALPESDILRERDSALLLTAAVETAIFLSFFVIIWLLMRRLVVRNMQQVNTSLSNITAGNLETVVDVRETVEFSHLSDDINLTVDTLKRYIAEAAARIDKELEFARAIQASVLPRVFPAFPDRKEFEIYATMTPARDVGGDFYDFFLTDEHHLAMVIADVSGKGIPAAMFMMSAKTMIKNRALEGGSPAEILRDVNARLFTEDEKQLFVTVWLAILDLRTGSGMAANAGHEHPALRRADGVWELVIYKHSPALCVFEALRFREHAFQLQPGESIFVYTDGVTEATNAQEELFGDERLLTALSRFPRADMQTLLQGVKEEIDRFVGEAEQFDDLTMLGMTWFGPEASPGDLPDEPAPEGGKAP